MLDQICDALQKTFDPSTSHTVRIDSQQFLESFKNHPSAIEFSLQLCTFSNAGNLSLYLKTYGLLLLEERVKYQWNFIDTEAKNQIKSVLETLFPSMALLEGEFTAIRHKYCRIVARTAVREWPQLWPALSQLLLGQSETNSQSINAIVCMIFTDLCEQVFSLEASASIEDERRSELTTSIALLAKSLVPVFLRLFWQCSQAISKNEYLLKVLLRCFVCCYSCCSPCQLFLQESQFLASLLAVVNADESSEIVVNYAVELVEIICSQEYNGNPTATSNLNFLLGELDTISRCLLKFLANSKSRGAFLTLVVALEKLTKDQICHSKHPLKTPHIQRLVKLFIELEQVPAIQVLCITSSLWPLLFRHAFWRSQTSLTHDLGSNLLNAISVFLSGSAKSLFDKSRSFAEGELTAPEFELYYSQVTKNYSEVIGCIATMFPDEICTFSLPAVLEAISNGKSGESKEWTPQREKKVEALLFFLQNIVRAFCTNEKTSQTTTGTEGEQNSAMEMRQKINQYFSFTLNQLCMQTFSDAESIFFQLDAILACLKYIIGKNVAFEYGILYTKMFHLIYEFQDSNTLYKTRVKERVHSILNTISHNITPPDALMFTQHGLEISKSGYVFPEMNTVLIDFLLNLNLTILQENASSKFPVLELVSSHIVDAASRLELGVSPKHFLSLVGMYLAAKRYKKPQFTSSNASANQKASKFLEGDLQPCHEISGNVTKLTTLLIRITQKRQNLPQAYLNDCLSVVLPKILNFVKFMHSLQGCDPELESIQYVFLLPFNAKASTCLADQFSLRAHTSDSTLESFLNRFSNWFDGIRRSTYQLIGIAFEFNSFWTNSMLIDLFLETFGSVNSFDLLSISNIFDSIFAKFIQKCPTEYLIGALDRFLFAIFLNLSQRCSKEWSRVEVFDAEDDAEEEEEIFLRTLRACSRSLVNVLGLTVDTLAQRGQSIALYFEGFLEMFLLSLIGSIGLNRAGDGIISKNFEILFKVLALAKQSSNLNFSQAIWKRYNSLMDAMISALKNCSKEEETTQNLLFAQMTTFTYEMHDWVDFFSWIGKESDPMLVSARKRFQERTAVKSKKEVIRGVLRNFYEVRKDSPREIDVFKVKNLSEKLVLLRDDKADVKVEDQEDFSLSNLFE
jgi:hypothetical protein